MLIRSLEAIEEIVAGDNTYLKELLHPDRQPEARIRYSLAWARVPVGKESTLHKMLTSEVYYIVSGQGRMYIDGQERDVKAGDAIYIPPGAGQHIANTGNEELVFLCIVDPAWRKEDEVIEPRD